MLSASSSSSRRDDLRLGLESEVVDEFARDLRREIVDSFSSSSLSLSLRLDFETSEPALDRPELDLPKLNMMAVSFSSAISWFGEQVSVSRFQYPWVWVSLYRD